MFGTIRNAWKIPELRKKIFYTILLLIVFRFGSYVPVPYFSASEMAKYLDAGEGTLVGFLDLFSGGALRNATIFAMSISPYITASIIMQLLTVAIPALEHLTKDGEEGRKVMAQYTRYLTLLLGFIQASGMYLGLKAAVTPAGQTWLGYFTIVLTFTAGTAFLMWLGEQINDKGIGNGISLLIFAGIVSRGPSMIGTILGSGYAWYTCLAILACAIAVVAIVVFMQESERRVPIQYAKRVVGRKMYGGQSTHIPIKLLAAGVMPIIFASSFLMFPATVSQFFGVQAGNANWWTKVLKGLSPGHWVYLTLEFLLIIFFTYFYTAIQMNPVEMANNIKKNGGFIPGLRPGRPTSDYLSKVMTRILIAGGFFLGVMAILPTIMSTGLSISSTLAVGGTSVLIVVGVALETTKQIEGQMLMRHYKGFLE